MFAAISFNLFLNNAAGANSFVNKNTCAPPDLDLNTLNRNQTIKEYSYGPLNPDDEKGSKSFWQDKADLWNTTIEAAKQSKCSNCGAFDQKRSTLSKIEKAIGTDGKAIVKNANIGFCEFFWFKCAGARACDAWVGGGPIK